MTDLVLASASAARSAMLENAGLSFLIDPADIDEAAIKSAETERASSPRALARILADTKALHVAQRQIRKLVIGADQILVHKEQILSKAPTKDAARQQLMRLRGDHHVLISAVSVARDGEVLWSTQAKATLKMRNFSEEFLDDYLQNAGAALTGSVGCYHLEELGAQLFDRIEGDYFTVLGLPLLELLGFLRQIGILRS